MSSWATLNSNLLDIVLGVDSYDNAMVVVNQAGHIVRINKRAEQLFGYDRGELLGKPVEVLVPERFRRKHSGFRNSFFVHSSPRLMGMGRSYGRRRDGSEFPAEVRLNPIQTEKELLVLSEIIDVTERKGDKASMSATNKVPAEQGREQTGRSEAANGDR